MLLVTHNIALAGPIAGHFVAVDINGVVTEASDSLSYALEPGTSEPETAEEGSDSKEIKDVDNMTTGKLVLPEEIQEGRVAWKSILLFLKSLGGTRPMFFAVVWTLSMLTSPAAESFSVWFLGFWSSQYEDRPPEEVNALV